MKKIVVLLILLLTFVLAACGGQDAAAPTEPAPAEEMEATDAPPTEIPPTEAPPVEEPVEEPADAEAAGETMPPESVVAKLDHVPDPRLVNVSWEWVSRDPNGNTSPEIVVPTPENYTLFFNEDGTFNATLDCNNGSGVYATPSAGNIFMELGPTTMAACPEDSLAGDMINIFGGAVQSYRFEDNDQTLVMVWVAGGPLDYYRNADAEPVMESDEEAAGAAEVGAITEEASNLDLNGLATSYQWQVMPGNPIPQEGPGGQGFPPYILVTFDGATAEEVLGNYQLPRMYIFPVEAYVGMYNAAGNQTVADQVVRLGQLISTADGRTTLPESPMPLLPPPSNFMDRWAQFLDLDFGVGEGVRYVSDSPFRQSIGVWANDTTGYYYQGLTSDQTFYVSLYWPVATAALPNTAEDATEEQTAAANNPDTYPTYKQETIDTLNALTSADFSPDLSLLDSMAASLTFPLPGDTVGEEEAADETPEEGADSEDDEVDLEQPDTGQPTATVTAPDGIFIRSGPGTEYADIGVAPTGSSGLITGVSEDRQWWVIEVPVSVAEDQQGWVSASWVDAVNTVNVPVVEAPEVEAVEPSLTGVNWQWVSLTNPVSGTTAVNDPTRYTVLFNTDGTAAIKADCNNVGASYTADAGSISITLGPSTLAACPEDSLDQQYLASLSNAAVYFFQDGDLYLDLTADGGTMQFTAGDAQAPAPEPTPDPESPTSPASGILFNLVSYGPEGAEQSLIEGTQITATFQDQTVSGSAGCNDYTGQVTPVNDYFTVGPVAVTAKACAEPAGVMEQEQAYLAALQGTAGYEWQQGVAEGSLITGARLFYSLADGTTGFLNFIAQ